MKGLSVVLAGCLIWMMVFQEGILVLAQEAPWPGDRAKVSIAVMDLIPRGMSPEEVGVLSDRLRVELMLTERFDVMTRDRMNKILEEQEFQMTGLCDNEVCLVEIGRMIGVRKMVAGSIGKVGKLHSVSVWMVDVETGRMSQPFKADYSGEVERLQTEVMPRLARELAELPTRPRKSGLPRWVWMVVGGVVAGGAVAAMRGGKETRTTGVIKVDVPWPQ